MADCIFAQKPLSRKWLCLVPFIVAEEYKVGKNYLNIKPMLKSFANYLSALLCKYHTLPAIMAIEEIYCTNIG